jgi:nucleoid-associated protein YgaU
MGILDFMKSAGEKIVGGTTAGALLDHLKAKGLATTDLKVEYDAESATVKVIGNSDNQENKEKVLLALGNVAGVGKVDDGIAAQAGTPAGFYTVQKGDTLGSIAKAHYGKSGAYVKIFEANQPLLKDPDRIYPGQMLRMPVA